MKAELSGWPLRVIAAGAALGATLLACQALVGVTDEQGSPPPLGPVASASASADGASAPVDLCAHEQPPPAPKVPDSDDLPPVWFAVTALEGLPRPDGFPVGLDLDGLCTGFLGETAQDGGAPCQRRVLDEQGGIDNAGARAFAALPDGQGGRLFRRLARDIQQGERTTLIGLFRYNGKLDDPGVQVRFSTSEPLETSSCDGGKDPDASPLGAGCDVWSYSETSLGSGAPAGRLLDGHVTGGKLVVGAARPTNLDLAIHDLPLTLSHAFLVATLGEKAGAIGKVKTLEGVIAGRVAPAALFGGLVRALDTCTPAAVAGLRTVCEYRDLPATPEDDRTGAKACTHLSVGLRVQATQARLGAEVPETAVPPPACDAGLPSCE